MINIYFVFDNIFKMADVIQWDKVMGKKVRSIDGENIGKVENVNTDPMDWNTFFLSVVF
jgi:hypothetical protein